MFCLLLLLLLLLFSVDIMSLINFWVVSFQQIKREKALKDDLVRELESKELEMQLLLQRQKSVSLRAFLLENYPFTKRKLVFPLRPQL